MRSDILHGTTGFACIARSKSADDDAVAGSGLEFFFEEDVVGAAAFHGDGATEFTASDVVVGSVVIERAPGSPGSKDFGGVAATGEDHFPFADVEFDEGVFGFSAFEGEGAADFEILGGSEEVGDVFDIDLPLFRPIGSGVGEEVGFAVNGEVFYAGFLFIAEDGLGFEVGETFSGFVSVFRGEAFVGFEGLKFGREEMFFDSLSGREFDGGIEAGKNLGSIFIATEPFGGALDGNVSGYSGRAGE